MGSQPHTSAKTIERVDLNSLDVDAIFEMLRDTTPFFSRYSQTQDDIHTQCPFHGGGNERHPSFGICNNRASSKYGLYHCFACGASGNIIQLVNRLHDVDDINNVTLIQAVSDIAYSEIRRPIKLESCLKSETPPVTEVELMSYQCEHSDYLTTRHIDPLIQRVFDCGYDSVQEAVTFPVKNIKDGTVSFVVRRKIKYKQYHYPSGVQKPVYGLYEFYKLFPALDHVVIVESIINALTLWSWHIPAVALLGTGTQSQIDFLNTTSFKRFTLCLDGDDAGRNGTNKLQQQLKAYTQIIPMMPGKDVNDLTESQFRGLMFLKV